MISGSLGGYRTVPPNRYNQKKLKSEAFTKLNTEAVNYFYDHFRPKKWFSFTLLAIGRVWKLPFSGLLEPDITNKQRL